jgi:hypothetical protein
MLTVQANVNYFSLYELPFQRGFIYKNKKTVHMQAPLPEDQGVIRTSQALYIVERKGQISARDKFFLDPGRAILWALLSIKDIAPLSVREGNIQVFSTTTRSELATDFRFPLQNEFILVNYYAKEDIDYVVEYFSDDDFIEARDIGFQLVGLYRAVINTPLIAARYVQTIEVNRQLQPDWNPTYENLTRINRQATMMRPDQLPLIETTMLRFANTNGLVHEFDYTVNWENAWAFFIISKMQGYDVEEMKDKFERLFKERRTIDSLLTGGAVPGYDDCFNNIFGFNNPTMSSCFMDSTLLAMFAFKNSPFYEHMIVKDFMFDPQHGTICSDNPAEDIELRRVIQKTLREDVQRLMGGEKNFNCSLLRRYLGHLCTKNGLNEDLSVGIHDPAELYGRLTNALGYYPIVYIETATRATDEFGSNPVSVNSPELPQVFLPSLSSGNPDLQRISWPQSWTGTFENVNSGNDLTFRRVSYQIRRSDCIVVHLNRRYTYGDILLEEEQKRINNQGLANLTGAFDLMSLFGQQSSTQQLPVNLGNTMSNTNVEVYVRPNDPRLTDQTLLNPRRIEVEQEFNVDGRGFILRAVVFSPQNGHYATYLKCGTRWFLYDDLNTNSLISRRPVADEIVQQTIETRGVLFFYYPPFPPVTQAEQQKIQGLVQRI